MDQISLASFWFVALWLVLVFFNTRIAAILRQLQKKSWPVIKSWYQHRFWLLLTILVGVGTLIFFRHSFSSYFEGDEWVFFRFYQPAVSSWWWPIKGFVDTFSKQSQLNVHLVPLANMLYVIQYRLFGLKFFWYILSALALHAFTSLAVAKFVFELTESKKITLIATLLFAFNAPHSQAITWVVASIYTTLAVAFGMLSLAFLIKALKNNQRQTWLLSLIFLVACIWSKETGLAFLVLYPVVWWLISRQKKLQKLKKKSKSPRKIWHYLLVVAIFVATQFPNLSLLSQNQTSPSSNQTTKQESLYSPWIYSIFDFYERRDMELHLFRGLSFGLKAFSQNLIHFSSLKEVSIWITDQQFPFFNQEKSVNGRTYVTFINGPIPEVLSYGLSLSLLLLIIINKPPQTLKLVKKIGLIGFVLGIGPILAITLKFPWWGFTSSIDSRHLYHLTPFVVLLVAMLIVQADQAFCKKFKWPKHFFAAVLVGLYFIINSYWQTQTTLDLHKALSIPARINIIETLQQAISPVPKKLVLFTTSNRSYYGFGHWMLPFQTAFSHMLPAIFDRTYHPQGADYPDSFFTNQYLEGVPGGLVTQGYHQEGEYGLGYYLEEKKLIKALEKNGLTQENIFSFDFDGDDNSFRWTTAQTREEIGKLLDSRQQFASWQKHDFPDDFLSFSLDPEWRVQVDDDVYQIGDEVGSPIITITAYRQMSDQVFSQWVYDQQVAGLPIGPDFLIDMLEPDLDLARVRYTPLALPSRFFVAVGNGKSYFQFDISNKEQAELFLRTLDFED